MNKNIIVIGAGVIGLTTALVLKRKGYKNVTIVAKHLPGDKSIEYTSPYAGAHWRTVASNDNTLLQKLDTVSYNTFMEMSDKLVNKETGIMIVDSYDYFDNDILPEVYNPWHKDVVYNFEILSSNTRFPTGAKVGHKYTTVLINSPVYLQWLMKEFKKLGGNVIQQSLTHINEIVDLDKSRQLVIINCTGLGAKFLGGINDDALFPTRGQTIIVKAPYIKRTLTHLHADGSITYVIPRSDGTCILGGVAKKGDYNPFVDELTIQSILKRTRALCTELNTEDQLEIVGHGVGLRPTRVGGPRFENETKKINDTTLYITHAYGHGGFGYQSSWGSAYHTVDLMEQQNIFKKSKL